MGAPNGQPSTGIEAMFDSLWAKVLSRGMAIAGWPLLGFVAYELYTTGTEMVKAQRELAVEVRILSKDVGEHGKDIENHDGRIQRLERRLPGRSSQPSRDDE